MRIAIVGAGSAGMAMAKQIVDVADKTVSFVLFERRSEVGGIWQYDANVKEGKLAWEYPDGSLQEAPRPSLPPTSHEALRLRYIWHGKWQPGPMFDGLRTNIPCDLMSYRDNLFPQDTNLYPDRQAVQSYLEAYASSYDLRRFVRFNRTVTRVVKDTNDGGWTVESQPIEQPDNCEQQRERFTHVVLAHGRCSTPNIPNIEGLQTFTGRILHSAWYRDPTELLHHGEPRRVLVVGNASSGMDIARELSGFITRTLPCGLSVEEWDAAWKANPIDVFSSWHTPDKPPPMDYNPRDPDSPEWCRRINAVESIARIDGPRIHLADGTTIDDVPLVIFATGFLFDNGFMDQSTGPLYKYPLLPPSIAPTRKGFPSSSVYNMDDWLLLHSHDESLAILGLPITVVPFPFTEVQACYVIHRWLGRASKLPLLDTSIPPNDERRWSSRRDRQDGFAGGQNGAAGHDEQPDEDGVILRTTTHVYGKPSDSVYLDALLSMLRKTDPLAGMPVPWLDQYTSDGRGQGTPRGPEARYATSPWRIERRDAGRLLRRETLGY